MDTQKKQESNKVNEISTWPLQAVLASSVVLTAGLVVYTQNRAEATHPEMLPPEPGFANHLDIGLVVDDRNYNGMRDTWILDDSTQATYELRRDSTGGLYLQELDTIPSAPNTDPR